MRAARSSVVNVPTPKNAPGSGPRTLADLLYADPQKRRVPEEEWVALVQSIATGDQAALRALYDRAHRIVFTLTLRICGNPSPAEELMLDVFHDVWRRAATYDPQNGPVIGWVMNQARSRAIDRLRYEQRKKRVAPAAGDAVAEVVTESAIESRDDRRMLLSGLDTLTADERQAIETAFFAELTYAETAARLHQPLGTIKTRIRSGLEKLRRMFEDRIRLP
jgi:RNA polymerase sigma-70 factor (ECF subfamily)